MIIDNVYEMSWEDDVELYIQENPFSILYYIFGWRSTEISEYNYSNRCIWFDLEFFDTSDQYIWFMKRMGEITNGELKFTNIKILTDDDDWEWG